MAYEAIAELSRHRFLQRFNRLAAELDDAAVFHIDQVVMMLARHLLIGGTTAAEIMDGVPGAPGYSTVRTQLRVLERKGHVKHEEQGLRYVYMPTLPRHSARKSALKHLVDTFFEGSSAKAVAALLGGEAARVSDEELERIAELVKNARMAELVKNVKGESR